MTIRRFQVRWTEQAVADLEGIVGWIALDSPANAWTWFRKLKRKALTLQGLPNRGRVVPELLKIGIRSYRELVVGPYRIVYRSEGRMVWVLGVLDARRDLEDLLLERMLRI